MRGSIQRNSKRSWRLVYDVGRNHSGKRRQKAVTFKGSKREAEKELARLITEFENGGFVEPHKLTLADYLESWLKSHAAASVSPKTLERYTEICRNHLIPALGSHLLTKLNSMHIQACYAEAEKSGRRNGVGGGLSARTVLHHHRVLRRALTQAATATPPLIKINPTDGVTAPTPAAHDITVLDEDETASLLEAASGHTLYIPILIAVTTGMRRGEILALRWRDVNLERCSLSVVHSLEQTKEGLRFKSPKTKKGRRAITLPTITVEALRQHKAEQARIRLRLGMGRDDNGLVCSRYDGAPRSPRAFSKEFDRFIRKLDITRVTFHELRHSHATQLLEAGVHPKVVQERLGHSTVATTLDLYSHVTETLQEDAAASVDVALRAAIGKQRRNAT